MMRWERLRGIFLSIAIVLSPAGHAVAFDFSTFERNLDQSVVKIESIVNGNNVGGAGCIIDDKCSIVTNWHVVNGAISVQVRFEDSELTQVCDLVAFNTNVDVAIIRPRNLAGLAANWRPLTVSQPNRRIEKGTKVIYVGHPKSKSSWAHHQASVSNALVFEGNTFYQIQGDSTNGFSGAPVVGEDGTVLGVVCSAEDGGSVSMTYVVPSSYVLALNRNVAAQPFNGSYIPLRLPREIAQSTIAYTSSQQGRRGPAADEVRSANFGFASHKTVREFANQGQSNPAEHASYQHVLGRFVQNAELIEFRNSNYGFGFVVPRGAQLAENYEPARDRLAITVTEANSPYNVHIVATRIQPMQFGSFEEGIANLENFSRAAFASELGLNLLGELDPMTNQLIPDPRGRGPIGQVGRDVAQLPMFGPLVDVENQRAIWGFLYVSPTSGHAYVVTYAMNPDSFVIAHMGYDRSQGRLNQPNPPLSLLNSVYTTTSLFQL